VGIVMKSIDELLDVFVNDRVMRDVVHPLIQLSGRGELAREEQVGGLQEGAALRQLLDRIAAVAQNAGIAVDVGDRGAAGGGV